MELTEYQKIYQKVALGKTHEELSKDLRRYAYNMEYIPMEAILLEAADRLERFASLEWSVQQAFNGGKRFEKNIEADQ